MKLALGLIILVCGSAVFASDMEVFIKNPEVVFTDASARSCRLQIDDPEGKKPDDLKALSFHLGGYGILWKGPAPLNIQYIQIILKGKSLPGYQQYLNPISGIELSKSFTGSNQMAPVPPNMMLLSNPGCDLWIGGVVVRHEADTSDGTGTLQIVGTTTDENGRDVMVTGSAGFHFNYTAQSDP